MVATSKKATNQKPSASGVQPFRTKRAAKTTKKEENVLVPPQDVQEAIDAFREAQDQLNYFEGEATVHKNKVLQFAQKEYSKRLMNGENKGFKLQGIETIAMYVVQDASAGLSEEDVEAFREKWGEEAADDLITRDFASIRFNEKVLEANYDLVVEALQSLPDDVLENLFKPMAMKAKAGASDRARKYVQSQTELQEILRHLRLKNYIR